MSHRQPVLPAALLVLVVLLPLSIMAPPAHAGLSISVNIAPPPLPVYEQPPCPVEGYLWTPGYWAWSPDLFDYYWVPGTWVAAPRPGLLWTPGYWAWEGAAFVFHEGYWAPHVGFYGGIDYGHGYGGLGYAGGRWHNGVFMYDRSVTRVDETVVRNVYTGPVIEHMTVNTVSFNGGPGGTTVVPRASERLVEHESRVLPTSEQLAHREGARGDRRLHVLSNHGLPPVAGTARAGDFSRAQPVVASRAATTSGAMRFAHVRELPAHQRPPAEAIALSPRRERVFNAQETERRLLLEQQEADHRRLEAAHADKEERGALEQEHGRQTQYLVERHVQQLHELEAQRARPRPTVKKDQRGD